MSDTFRIDSIQNWYKAIEISHDPASNVREYQLVADLTFDERMPVYTRDGKADTNYLFIGPGKRFMGNGKTLTLKRNAFPNNRGKGIFRIQGTDNSLAYINGGIRGPNLYELTINVEDIIIGEREAVFCSSLGRIEPRNMSIKHVKLNFTGTIENGCSIFINSYTSVIQNCSLASCDIQILNFIENNPSFEMMDKKKYTGFLKDTGGKTEIRGCGIRSNWVKEISFDYFISTVKEGECDVIGARIEQKAPSEEVFSSVNLYLNLIRSVEKNCTCRMTNITFYYGDIQEISRRKGFLIDTVGENAQVFIDGYTNNFRVSSTVDNVVRTNNGFVELKTETGSKHNKRRRMRLSLKHVFIICGVVFGCICLFIMYLKIFST